MEQVQPSRGPYETFRAEDPALLSSPEPSPAVIEDDLQQSLANVKSTYVQGEDLVPTVDSVDEGTAHMIADEAVLCAGTHRIACICCPGIYLSLRRAHPNRSDLFMDFDPRFSGFGENTVIVPIDQPLMVAQHLPSVFRHAFAVVVLDLTYLILPLDQMMQVVKLLTLLHKPLKLILIGTETLQNAAMAVGLHMLGMRPHGRGGVPVRVYTTIPNTRRLH